MVILHSAFCLLTVATTVHNMLLIFIIRVSFYAKFLGENKDIEVRVEPIICMALSWLPTILPPSLRDPSLLFSCGDLGSESNYSEAVNFIKIASSCPISYSFTFKRLSI